uniref:Putative secreted protein n=1 Tax=Ixodes scapularis TaxID=6945 RepID=A0A4D5RYR1_IXOSC
MCLWQACSFSILVMQVRVIGSLPSARTFACIWHLLGACRCRVFLFVAVEWYSAIKDLSKVVMESLIFNLYGIKGRFIL